MERCSLFFGLVYPAYGSIAAIESSSSEDDTHWLIYWLIFSLITILENLAWPLLQWYAYHFNLSASVCCLHLQSSLGKAECSCADIAGFRCTARAKSSCWPGWCCRRLRSD